MHTSSCLCSSLVRLPDSEKWRNPVEFCCYHVYPLEFVLLNFQSRHLGFLTPAYLLFLDQHQYSTRGMSVPENVGVAVAILLLVSVELKTCCMLYGVWTFSPILSCIRVKRRVTVNS